jgi:hypothetical protein
MKVIRRFGWGIFVLGTGFLCSLIVALAFTGNL